MKRDERSRSRCSRPESGRGKQKDKTSRRIVRHYGKSVNRFVFYELEKQLLKLRVLTSTEYEAAVRKLAKKWGV